MIRKELRVVKEEELSGDLMDLIDFLVEIREMALEKGYTSIEMERYYGDEDGYFAVTGLKSDGSGRFDQDYWGYSGEDFDEE